MPPALRLGANPPFQRVEETRGVCKKARLFIIVMAFLLHRSKGWVFKGKKLSKMCGEWIPACAAMTGKWRGMTN